MHRSQRLLDPVQVMRRHRRRVTARVLAEELGISVRTVYRDIQTLIEQGFRIPGGASFGYQLRSGSLLPPLNFADDELEAIVLGLRWAAQRGDPAPIYPYGTEPALNPHVGIVRNSTFSPSRAAARRVLF